MSAFKAIRNPKQKYRSEEPRATWFRYYAGFSEGFVGDVIAQLNLCDRAMLLDPWLGAGTTTQVAAARGYHIRGFDLNPAMIIVAKARVLPTSEIDQIGSLMEAIIECYERRINTSKGNLFSQVTDPLEQWLDAKGARLFRILERSVVEVVLKRKSPSTIPIWRRTSQVSPILAFFYVGLFRTLRNLISNFQSSNPTWVKVADGNGRVHLSPAQAINCLYREVETLSNLLEAETQFMPVAHHATCLIRRSSSLNLPVASNSVDAVISSPPYCTRIDYVRATLPELAVTGYPNGHFIRRLREEMIGTTTISDRLYQKATAWGSTCLRFLSLVQRHPSKASSTYYLKYYTQYFACVFRSLYEINRVLRRSGRCILVVQDSYYKNLKIDVPRIFIEMSNELGLHLDNKLDFHVKRTLAGINPEVKRYRNIFEATESVICLSK